MNESTPVTRLNIGSVRRDKNLRGLGVYSLAGTVYLYFQSSKDDATTFHVATSTDGLSFQLDPRDLTIETGEKTVEDITKLDHFSLSEYGNYFLLLYAITQDDKKILKKAWSKDLYHWSLEGPMMNVSTEGIIVPDYSYKNNALLLGGDKTIDLYFSKDLITWAKSNQPILSPRPTYFDANPLQVSGTYLTEKGILVLYLTCFKNSYTVGVALLAPADPTKILWRANEPIWQTSREWELEGAYPVGVILVDHMIISYWHVPGKGMYEVAYAVYKIGNGLTTEEISLHLDRALPNPIIAPNPTDWESHGTFNPAAIYDNGKVHILYRAQGDDWVSVVGYASSKDGVHIDERLKEPIYRPTESFEYTSYIQPENVTTEYMSAGGCGGVEDARITRIDDRFYMTYVAFNGYDQPRIALTSITAQDFLNKRWLWEKPVLISPPGVIDKNAVIFPEKINGKYCIMHRIFPDILIDFVDSLEFDGKTNFLKGEFKISPRPDFWDSRKVAAGAPPIKTKDGWLLIYHATCDQENASRYLVGAMVLDLNDPTKVLYRSKAPILEPKEWYEWEGFKGGVVYPCGAVVIDNTLYVYYGGADWHVCVATANLDEFLNELKYSDVARLSQPVVEPLFDAKKVARSQQNPILSPNPDHPWEASGTLNGSILVENQAMHLIYRADSCDQDYHGQRLKLRTVGIADSPDGVHFTNRRQLVVPSESWDLYGCEDPRVTKIDNDYFIFYTALGGFPYGPENIKVGLALFHKELSGKPEKHLITPFNAKAMVLFPEKINGRYAVLVTVDTDLPPKPNQIGIAYFDRKEDMYSEYYWKKWYDELDKHVLALRRMTSDQIEVGAVPIKTDKGWLFVYSHMQHYDKPASRILGVEAVMLDLSDPQKIIAWTDEPLLVPRETYEVNGVESKVVFPSGAYIANHELFIYYGAADEYCALATFDLEDVYSEMRTNALLPLKVEKTDKNPILKPISDHVWESQATFNPGAIRINGTTHLMYRAMGPDNTSVLGHATTQNGVDLLNRSEIPAYAPRSEFESKKIPNANSGCEDPRLTVIGKTLFMCYTAYNGADPTRIAMTTISVDDFAAGHYTWSDPILLSPPGIDDKDGALFPEKINGKYCVIHRVQNSIVLDFEDSFDAFNGNHWLTNAAYIPPRGDSWDSEKIGVCAPPIKTEKGWLLLYHGVSKYSHQYRVGAMLLDLGDPSKVLSRTPWPVLEPDQPYEKDGTVHNVVFPCGAIVNSDTLFIYYGGADTCSALATISLSQLVNYLLEVKEKTYLSQ